MAARVLVVTTTALASERVDALIRAHVGADAEVRVVAPSTDLSPLQWLVDDVDGARREAARRAVAVAANLSAARAEPRVGDAEPLQAIEDALRVFPADEIIVVTPSDEEAGWLESGRGEAAVERFRLPVTHLVADPPPAPRPEPPERGRQAGGGAAALAREAERGQSGRTPLLAFAGVSLVLATAFALLALVAFLLYYFA
jgi:hypothetical protein